MEDSEEKLQKAFNKITSELEIVFQRDSIIVADNSIFVSFRDIIKTVERCKCQEYNEGFIEWWRDNVPDNVFYMRETVSEFNRGISGLNKISGDLEKRIKGAFGQTRLNLLADAISTNRVAIGRCGLLRDFITPHYAERFIPEWIGSDIESGVLNNIYRAFCEIGGLSGTLVDKGSRYKGRRKSKQSEGNDQVISAKVVGISSAHPITLLCRDGDFKRLLREFYRNKDYYSAEYDLDVFDYDVEVLFQHRKGLAIYKSDGSEGVLSSMIECGLEDAVGSTAFS